MPATSSESMLRYRGNTPGFSAINLENWPYDPTTGLPRDDSPDDLIFTSDDSTTLPVFDRSPSMSSRSPSSSTPSPQQADYTVDLRELDYVSEFDSHIMCPICRCPFIQPLRLQCDHVFCQSCLHMAYKNWTSGAICPTCRSDTYDEYEEVPRLITHMCDEVLVKCPFAREGCKEVSARGCVQIHVDKYCLYRPMKCPLRSCRKTTPRKKLHISGRKCLHGEFRCNTCQAELLEQDLEDHASLTCPSLETTCPDCKEPIYRVDLETHIETCIEAIHPCSASQYGCPQMLRRTDLTEHEKTCPLVTMGPYLAAQTERISSLESTLKLLRERNEVLEGGIASMRASMRRSNSSSSIHSPQTQGQLTVTPTPSRRHRIPHEPLDLNHTRSSNQANPPPIQQQPAENPEPETGETPTTTLLSLHESLRADVSNIRSLISDLDARASLAIMNETARINEEVLHTNAAVQSLRMQVHWLINNERARNGRIGTTGPGVGAAGAGRVLGAGTSTAAGAAAAASAQNGSGVGSSSAPANAQSGIFSRATVRRLSEGREGTKL